MEIYKDPKDMTKSELLTLIDELELDNNSLREDINNLEDELADYQVEYMGLEKYQEGEWINVDDLIYRLKLENLYDDKMEKFIEDYIKWYNN